MALLTIAEGVAKKVGIEVPSEVVADTSRDMVEMLECVNEGAKRIFEAHDWEILSTIATITGDGSDEDFALPSDYARMPNDTQLWSSSLETPLSHIKSRDRWLDLDVRSFDFVINAWIKYGGEIHIKPALASGVTVQYFYISNLIVAPSSGSNKTEFTLDTDTFRLSENLLKLRTIYEWYENKGLPSAKAEDDYEELLEREINRDKGARVIKVGKARLPRNTNVAYPAVITE